jgi:hypothetical protein
MFLHVAAIKEIHPFELVLKFSDGVVKRVDLRNELFGEIFEPLNDADFFQKAIVNPETQTVEWPNGADFAPEFLDEAGQEIKQVA